MNDLFNLRTAKQTIDTHGLIQENQLRILKMGPEPFNTEILRAAEYATSMEIPELTRDVKEVRFAGSPLRFPGQLQIGSGTTSIGWRGSESFVIRNTLEKWAFEQGNPLDGTGRFCVGEDSTIQLVVVNKNGTIIRGYEFTGVFISNLGPMPFTSEGDEIVNYSCDFSYSYWCPLDLDGIVIPGFDRETPTAVDKLAILDKYEDVIAARDSNPPAC